MKNIKKHGYGVANETLLTNLKWFFLNPPIIAFKHIQMLVFVTVAVMLA